MLHGRLLAPLPRILGITGGIGTGKSTVSRYLSAHHGLPVLDADGYAQASVATGSKNFCAIVGRYGSAVLQADNTLNRAALAQIIFQNPLEKRWLEALIHPDVRHRLETERALLEAQPTIVMEIPLLFEAEMTDLVSEIWVVSCRPEQQLSRLMVRSGLSQAEAQRRIDSQMPLTEKCGRADVILDNSDSVLALYAQVERALRPLQP